MFDIKKQKIKFLPFIGTSGNSKALNGYCFVYLVSEEYYLSRFLFVMSSSAKKHPLIRILENNYGNFELFQSKGKSKSPKKGGRRSQKPLVEIESKLELQSPETLIEEEPQQVFIIL